MSAIGKKGRETQAAFDAWQTEYEAISQEVGLASIEEEQDRLCNTLAKARVDALAAPVRSLDHLAAKVGFIKDQFDGDYDAAHMDAIITDVRRLAAMGGL